MGFLRSFSVVSLLLIGYIHAQTPKIIPEKNSLFLLKGSDLKLDCVLESASGDTVSFYKANDVSSPGTVIEGGNTDGFVITTKGHVQKGMTTKTTSLLKKNVELKDRAVYKCKKTSSNDDTSITVYVFEVKQEGGVLNGTTGVDLKCEAEGIPSSIEYKMSWRHNENSLMEGEKYNIHPENGTLRINNPERTDMGEYFCTFVFPADQLNVTAMAIELKAVPAILDSDHNKNMVQGDTLELKCKVTGYPMPKVSWLKDGKVLNQTGTTRIHLVPYEGAETGKLQIYNLEYTDEGEYTCVASSDVGFEDAQAKMIVKVKDKLAALWPFLGIVAEVIILCVIILVYEKKRSKQMSDDDDAPDGNAEKATDNKDVRHRRT